MTVETEQPLPKKKKKEKEKEKEKEKVGFAMGALSNIRSQDKFKVC